jgi:hypothetical protein
MKPLSIVLFAAATALLLGLPFLILGHQSYITIHDNLDAEFVYLKVLKDQGVLMSSGNAIVEPVMNGLPRNVFRTPYNVLSVVAQLTDPFTAYVSMFILGRFLAFISMFFLVIEVLKRWNVLAINVPAVATAFLYAFVPFYSIYSLTLPLLPLVIWAFLKLEKKQNLTTAFAIIALYPFFSTTLLIEPFFLIPAGLYFLLRCVQEKKVFWVFFSGLVVLTFLSVVSDIGMFKFMADPNHFETHRHGWNDSQLPNWRVVPYRTIVQLIETQYHAGRFNTLIILSLTLGVSLLFWFKGKLAANRQLFQNLFWIFFCILCICGIYGVYDLLVFYTRNSFPLFATINFARFYLLIPIFFMVLLSGAFALIAGMKHGKVLIICFTAIQCMIMVSGDEEVMENIHTLFGSREEKLHFDQFVSEEMFQSVANHIGRPQKDYRVVGLGIYSSILQWNGFYTLDAYHSVYPAIWHERFRKLIARELDIDPVAKAQFDNWGNRCYAFCADIQGASITFREDQKQIQNLDWDTTAMNDLKIDYVISSCPILNPQHNNLIFDSSFSNSQTPYDIYLYKHISMANAESMN